MVSTDSWLFVDFVAILVKGKLTLARGVNGLRDRRESTTVISAYKGSVKIALSLSFSLDEKFYDR